VTRYTSCRVILSMAAALWVTRSGGDDAFCDAPNPTPQNTCATLKSGPPEGDEASALCERRAEHCLRVTADCFELITREASEARAANRKRGAPDEAAALQLYRDYRSVRKWRRKIEDQWRRDEPGKGVPAVAVSASREEQKAGDEVLEALREDRLLEPFFGALVTGPVFQTVTKTPDQSAPGTAVSATVMFESKHTGSIDYQPVHFSIAGKVGYEPIFLMTVVKDAAPGTPVSPSFSSGLVWDIGPNLGVPLPRGSRMPGEMTVFGRYGQSRPSAAQIVDESGATARIVVPSDAGNGLSRDYWEAGVKAVFFRNELGVASAHERGYLLPAASLQMGVRRDGRFLNDPALAGYNSPELRLFFGFRLNALRVFQASGSEGTYELTFGVEHDWALRRGGLPAGTRLVLAGSVNLLKAFGGSGGVSKSNGGSDGVPQHPDEPRAPSHEEEDGPGPPPAP
jgi:hypothetical protein